MTCSAWFDVTVIMHCFTSALQDEDMAGTVHVSPNSCGYVTIFVPTLTGLNKDPLLTLTENGPSVLELIDHLQRNVDTQEVRDFIVAVSS